MEEDLENQAEHDREVATGQESKHGEYDTAAHFYTASPEVDIFDLLTANDGTCVTRTLDAIERKWYRNYLFTSITQHEESNFPEGLHDFRKGRKAHRLNFSVYQDGLQLIRLRIRGANTIGRTSTRQKFTFLDSRSLSR